MAVNLVVLWLWACFSLVSSYASPFTCPDGSLSIDGAIICSEKVTGASVYFPVPDVINGIQDGNWTVKADPGYCPVPHGAGHGKRATGSRSNSLATTAGAEAQGLRKRADDNDNIFRYVIRPQNNRHKPVGHYDTVGTIRNAGPLERELKHALTIVGVVDQVPPDQDGPYPYACSFVPDNTLHACWCSPH